MDLGRPWEAENTEGSLIKQLPLPGSGQDLLQKGFVDFIVLWSDTWLISGQQTLQSTVVSHTVPGGSWEVSVCLNFISERIQYTLSHCFFSIYSSIPTYISQVISSLQILWLVVCVCVHI
jgi:hypothetical protein